MGPFDCGTRLSDWNPVSDELAKENVNDLKSGKQIKQNPREQFFENPISIGFSFFESWYGISRQPSKIFQGWGNNIDA